MHNNTNRKTSRTRTMKYYWIRDKEPQKQFNIMWAKEKSNETDFFFKFHPILYHSERRTKYIKDKIHHFDENIPSIVTQYSMDRSSLRGYADI